MKSKERLQAGVFRRVKLGAAPRIKLILLKVNSKMFELQGRVLPPPRILYANNMDARASDGTWNLRGQKVIAYSRDRSRAEKYSLFGTAKKLSRHGLASRLIDTSMKTQCDDM